MHNKYFSSQSFELNFMSFSFTSDVPFSISQQLNLEKNSYFSALIKFTFNSPFHENLIVITNSSLSPVLIFPTIEIIHK